MTSCTRRWGWKVSLRVLNPKRDSESGLDYFLARYYSSPQGRFTSPDSLKGKPKNPQSLNLYSYVQNNPIAAVDPSGHLAIPSAAAFSGLNPDNQDPRPYAEKLIAAARKAHYSTIGIYVSGILGDDVSRLDVQQAVAASLLGYTNDDGSVRAGQVIPITNDHNGLAAGSGNPNRDTAKYLQAAKYGYKPEDINIIADRNGVPSTALALQGSSDKFGSITLVAPNTDKIEVIQSIMDRPG